MKKTICLLLVLSMAISLCACGKKSYGVTEVVTLAEQDYSLAFRNNDEMYFYVVAAIEYLNANGKVTELSRKWFGADMINFGKNAKMLDSLQTPEPRTLIIGVDINSFPMAYVSNGSYWGFDVELAMAVCDLLEWTLKVQQIDKENVYVELYSGNIDVAWGGIALDENELANEKYTQYGPYIHNKIVIASRDSSNIWNTLKLGGRNLAMSSTAEAWDALETDPKLKQRLGQITRLAGGTTECFSYLYSGKCDVVLTDSTALYYYNSH